MKKFYLLRFVISFVFFFMWFTFTNVVAQVYNGNLTLSSQAQIDTFNFTIVNGDLIIKEQTPGNITNLYELSELAQVRELFVENNSALTSLDSLNNLIKIGGNNVIGGITITNNSMLTNIDALSGIDTINGSINIGGNNSLTNIGLYGLKFVLLDFSIYNNALLNSLTGLSNLNYSGTIFLENNDSLTNLNGLSNLQEVGPTISLANNDALTNIDGLLGLTRLAGSHQIFNNDALTNLNGLSNLKYFAGGLFIGDNELLTNLDGLSNIDTLSLSLDLINNPNLSDISALSKPFYLWLGAVNIDNNDALLDINAFSNIDTISALWILNNDGITNLDSLSNLRYIGEQLRIENNTSLTSFCGLRPFVLLFSVPFLPVTISGNAFNPTLSQISSEQFCSGDIPTSFIAVLLGENETPPVETDGSGGGKFLLNETRDTLHFWIRVCKLDCPFTSAHFHNAPDGVPGSIVKDITQFFMVDSLDSMSYFAHGIWTKSDAQPLTPSLIDELLAGNIYVNIHSTGHPTGEIRGQLTYNIPVSLYANLTGEQVVPPANTMGSGEANFTLSGDGDSLYFNVVTSNLSAIRSGHFHKAPVGHPGNAVNGFSFFGDTATSGWWMSDDFAQPLTPDLVADLLGCYIYIDTHPTINDPGEIRGQIYKTEELMMDFMTIFAAENDVNPENNAKLKFYSLSEGKQFQSVEGEITGYTGEKKIADLTIDIGGNIYFLNNTWTSMLYRIKPSAIDKDGNTPVYAKQMGRLRTYPDEKLVWVSGIQFINGKLYGIDDRSNKLYEINPYNAYVKELAILDQNASSFALGEDGSVYLLNSIDKNKSEIWKFEKFPISSELSLVTAVSSLDRLESFTSHPNGRLYASDKANLYEIDINEKEIGVLKDHTADISAMDFNIYAEKNKQPAATVAFTDISEITAVEGFTGIPTKFNLSQNYPNPFNPATTIKYQLPEASYVKLNIYNSLGELVRTLVNETKNAGYYEVTLDASSMASGMYIYKIEAGSFVSSAKMILLK